MSNVQLACASARSRVLAVGGLALHLLEWGETGRPGLCFLHGGAAHAHWFDAVVAPFVGRFHVIALDQRGHGASAWASPPAYATEDFVADLVGVVDALRWPDVVLVGHSMGGANALAFSAWHPDRVRGLVVLDSRPSIPPERLRQMRERGARPLRRHPTREAAVDAFRLLPRETFAAPALLRHMAETGVVERDGAWIARFDPETYGERRPADTWTLLDRITAPALIVRGRHSPILTADMAERLVAALKRVSFVEIPDSYHHLTLDAPAAVVAALQSFLPALL
jgi:pimeloyl-ACP methyl ester carboxylesterase